MMPRFLIILVFVVLHVSAVWAQPVPADIKSAVGFIFVSKEDQLVAIGTCFFVGVSAPKADHFILYTVTAKHVLQDPTTNKFFERVMIRVNTKDGKSELLPFNLRPDGPKKNVFTHSDPTIDLAVIQGGPDGTKFDFKVLPDERLLTKNDIKAFGITEGTEVVFTGLFPQQLGQRKNNPIVLFGRLALLTDEPILWDKNKMVELYLIESASYGGSSGSPVFLYVGPQGNPGRQVMGDSLMKFAGVMQGYVGEVAPIQSSERLASPPLGQSVDAQCVDQLENVCGKIQPGSGRIQKCFDDNKGKFSPVCQQQLMGAKSEAAADILESRHQKELAMAATQGSRNIGIAAVVPAHKIREILFGDELKARRGF